MYVIATLVLCIAAVSAVPTRSQRIVGGSPTSIESYPSIASLLYSWNGNNFAQSCGGTIISSRSILTAAHCPHGDAVGRWRVRFGSTWANSGGAVYNLASISIHPSYNPGTMNNDIAIMRTANMIAYNNVIQPASIAGSNYNLNDNQVVWAAGWGTITSGGPSSEQLRHVQIWTINQAACGSRYSSAGLSVTDNMLCSGVLDVGGRDQCQGDSGGPLYHNGVVVGVCSFGIGCGLPQYPGVNVRVSRFVSWIQSNA